MYLFSYIHTLDPFLIKFTDNFGIRWYGLSYLIGFLIAFNFFKWLHKNGKTPLNITQINDLIFYSILGVILGGRFGYVLFYDPSLLFSFSTKIPFWGALAINNGGMSSHGGMIGVFISFIIFSKKNHLPMLHIFDLGAIGVLPGLFLGRISNFINAELWGRKIINFESNSWWHIKYPTEITEKWLYSNDQRLTEINNIKEIPKDEFFYKNIIREIKNGNENIINIVEPLLTPYWPSQIIQAFFEGPILFITLILIQIKFKKKGMISSFFLMFYGIYRILTEFVREPDEGVTLIFGFTRGQQLSLIMIIAGLLLFTISNKKLQGNPARVKIKENMF